MTDQTDTAPAQDTSAIELTAEIVSAYVAKNNLPHGELPAFIRTIHEAVTGLGKPQVEAKPAEPLKPAVPVKKSITDEYIISLEDGRKLKSMKRYLAGLGMTPNDYRAKWGLPNDYPMVAPSYAAHRSTLAKSLGLGRRASQEAEAEFAAEPEAAAEPTAAPKKGRKKAA